VAERASFEFTVDDLVDVWQRVLARSNVVRDLQRGGTILTALAVAAIAFVAVRLPMPGRILCALGSAVIVELVYPGLRRSLVRSRLRAFWREKLKGDGPFTCEVELMPDGVTTRQLSTTISIPWSQVASVTEVPDGVEIWGRNNELIVVRERAFASPEARRRFVEAIRSRVQGDATRPSLVP
jgi:hypothetical protein